MPEDLVQENDQLKAQVKELQVALDKKTELLDSIVKFDPIRCPKCHVVFETDSNAPHAWCPKCGYEPGNDKSWVIKRQWQIINEEKQAIREQKGLVRALHASWKHERSRVEVIAIAAEKANLDLMSGIAKLTAPEVKLTEAVNILNKMEIPGLREERGKFDTLIVGIASERDRWHTYYDSLMIAYRKLEVALKNEEEWHHKTSLAHGELNTQGLEQWNELQQVKAAFENERQEAMAQAVTIARLGAELKKKDEVIEQFKNANKMYYELTHEDAPASDKPVDDKYKGDGSDQQDLDDGGVLEEDNNPIIGGFWGSNGVGPAVANKCPRCGVVIGPYGHYCADSLTAPQTTPLKPIVHPTVLGDATNDSVAGPAPMTIKQIETLFQSEDGRLQIAIYIAKLEEKVARLEAANDAGHKGSLDLKGVISNLRARIAELVQAVTDLDATKRHLLKEHERATHSIDELYKKNFEQEGIMDSRLKVMRSLEAGVKVIEDIIENDLCDTCKYLVKKYFAREEEAPADKNRGAHDIEEAPTDAPEPKWMKIWFDDDACLVWEGKNLKPSEIALMAAALQEHALKMMDGCCLKCGYCADDCHCPKEPADEFPEELDFILSEYVEEDDETMTPGAAKLKDAVVAILGEHGWKWGEWKDDVPPSPAKPPKPWKTAGCVPGIACTNRGGDGPLDIVRCDKCPFALVGRSEAENEIALLKRILIRYHRHEPFTAQEAQYILDTVRAARRHGGVVR